MGKIKKILALLLGAGVVASGAVLSACSDNSTDSGNGTQTQAENIVKDEESWNKAFEEFDYSNFSFNMCGLDADGEQANVTIKISEKVVYYKVEVGDDTQLDEAGYPGYYEEYYSVKNDDGTYTTYMKWDSRAEFVFPGTLAGLSKFDNGSRFNRAKEEINLKVDYNDCFKDFIYDGQSGSYSCDKEVIAKHNFYDGVYNDMQYFYCTNNVVTVRNNSVVSVGCHVNKLVTECHCEESNGEHNGEDAMNATLEYYDIGTTSFNVPPEVIDEAEKNYNKLFQ